ncbi:hypothetical protein JCM8097_002335 [Rhodosporidiobolus ruineniae]
MATDNKCCVCGVVTVKQCGPCQKAGFDIRFCSEQHRKLVESAHNLACGSGGESTTNFRFPPLTPDEVKQGKALLEHPYLSYGLKAKLRVCVPPKGTEDRWSTEECAPILDDLTKPHSYGPYHRAAAVQLVRQELLNHIANTPGACPRALQHLYTSAGLSSDFACGALDLNPCNSFLGISSPPPFWEKRAFPLHDPLYVLFQHRILVMAALHQQEGLHPGTVPDSFAAHGSAMFLAALQQLGNAYPLQVRGLVGAIDRAGGR